MIATVGIEIWHAAPVRQRHAAVVNGVSVPVRRIAERKVAISEQVIVSLDDAIRPVSGGHGRCGDRVANQARELPSTARLQRPAGSARSQMFGQRSVRARPTRWANRAAEASCDLARFARQPKTDLFPVHLRQAAGGGTDAHAGVAAPMARGRTRRR